MPKEFFSEQTNPHNNKSSLDCRKSVQVNVRHRKCRSAICSILFLLAFVTFFTSLSEFLFFVGNTIANHQEYKLKFSDSLYSAVSWQSIGAEGESTSSRDHQAARPGKPRIAFVTYSFLEGGQFEDDHVGRFQRMIFAATKTWLQGHLYFVVMTSQSMPHYVSLCQLHASECERIVPILVDCPEGYWGDSPCCKMQEGLLFMLDQYPEYDWYYYGDDDQYMRVEYLEEFLSPFDAEDQAMIMTSGPFKRLGTTGYQTEGADVQKCSVDYSYMYPWGQPILYSRAGLQKVKKGFQMNGLRQQCEAFEATHDVGNQIFNWMHELPEVRLRFTQYVPEELTESLDFLIGMHGVARKIDIYDENSGFTFGMETIYSFYQNKTYPKPPYQYNWVHEPAGFRQTETFKQHGVVTDWESWHTMSFDDCRGPNQVPETQSSQDPIARLGKTSFDVCIAGAGMTGSVLAQQYGDIGMSVLVVEKLNHIGGTCYDYLDDETGLRVGKYGHCIFQSSHNSSVVYAMSHSGWIEQNLDPVLEVNGTCVPLSVEIDTVNALLGLNLENNDQVDAWLETERAEYTNNTSPPSNAEEMALSQVGMRLYKALYRPWLIHRYGHDPKDLVPEAASELPVRLETSLAAEHLQWSAIPSTGFTGMMRKLLGPNIMSNDIEVHLNMDYFAIRDAVECKRTYFTGPLDDYFAGSGLERLAYSSVSSKRHVKQTSDHVQEHPVVFRIGKEGKVERVVEYNHFPGQPLSNYTVYFTELPSSDDLPMFVLPTQRNLDLLSKYRQLALNESNVTFIGGPSHFPPLGLDDAIMNALEMFQTDVNTMLE